MEACIDHVLYIRKSVDELALSKERSVLLSLGIHPVPSDSSDVESTDVSADEDDYSSGFDQGQSQLCSSDCQDSLAQLSEVVKQSEFHWFEVVARIEASVGWDNSEKIMTQLSSSIDEMQITKKEKQLLEISRGAFLADEKFNSTKRSKHAVSLNGCIVTDSESDGPDVIEKAVTPLNPSLKDIIQKRRSAIKRQVQRLKAKRIEEQHFLKRRRSRRVKGILKDCPDIGHTIEEFVKSCSVGADAGRRTGILMFDGNSNVNKKVTYERLRSHLESHYGRHFAYGTVVQLCVARNRRYRAAMRYKGIAQVTTRHARKGFNVKYNPDCHWSGALYRALDYIQYTDGKQILNVNRDDASGFHLDTLVTHKQYATPAVRQCDVLTTYTDYVKKYPSTLLTTSYNFQRPRQPLSSVLVSSRASHFFQSPQHSMQ